MTVPSVADLVAEFSSAFSGHLLRPADVGYEEAREFTMVWSTSARQ